MKLSKNWMRLLVAAALATAGVRAANAEPLKDGDRVVFYGDSITEQKLYTRYLQQYVDVRYPDAHIRFFNAGWGGDTAPGALRRLERDVLVLQPNVVTLFFGMNDGHYKQYEKATGDEYRAGMEGLIQSMQAHGVRVIIYTPGAVDYTKNARLGEVGYNDTLAQLGAICRELGEKYKCEVIDVHTPMLEHQTKKQKEDAKWTMIPDSVHPNNAGHLLMMRAMIPALAEPMPAVATVDASDSNAVKVDGDARHFTLQVKTPFWVEADSAEIAREAGVDSYVRPKVTVKNLPAGKYEVLVNQSVALTATADELAAGVPLAINTDNGRVLHELVRQKEELYFRAWREIRLPLDGQPKVGDVVKLLDDADAKLAEGIHEVANRTDTVTVDLLPAPAGENVALHKPYETSDPNKYGWGIDKLTDGSWLASGEHCFASGDVDAFPKTVTVDLQSAQTLNEVRFGVPEFGSTKTVVVSLSDDNKTFKEVGRQVFEQRKAGRADIKFEPTTARYVRLTYPDHYTSEAGYGPFFSFTTELEAYAVPAR
ncbi:MAG: GDSL-type esterase/lipase family protein [Tepidisphaeraceae bacterium]